MKKNPRRNPDIAMGGIHSAALSGFAARGMIDIDESLPGEPCAE